MKKCEIISAGHKLNVKNYIVKLLQPIFSILAGLFVGGIIIALMGENVIDTYITMFRGGFGSPYYFMSTLTRATPIIFCCLGVVVSWRAGLFNIGGEGQMIVGAITSVAVAVYLPIDGITGLLISLMAGIVAGGLYALLAAWLEARFGVLLLITTLLMNYIADYVTTYLLVYPMRNTEGDAIVVRSEAIPESMWIPRMNLVNGSTLHYGIVIALVLTAALIFINRKTVFGYESRISGLNPGFAEYGGIKQTKMMLMAMFISGALCALGGSIEVMGTKHAYYGGMITSTSFAWTGLMAALVADLNPVGTVICSIFLAGIQTGGAMLERSTNCLLYTSRCV